MEIPSSTKGYHTMVPHNKVTQHVGNVVATHPQVQSILRSNIQTDWWIHDVVRQEFLFNQKLQSIMKSRVFDARMEFLLEAATKWTNEDAMEFLLRSVAKLDNIHHPPSVRALQNEGMYSFDKLIQASSNDMSTLSSEGLLPVHKTILKKLQGWLYHLKEAHDYPVHFPHFWLFTSLNNRDFMKFVIKNRVHNGTLPSTRTSQATTTAYPQHLKPKDLEKASSNHQPDTKIFISQETPPECDPSKKTMVHTKPSTSVTKAHITEASPPPPSVLENEQDLVTCYRPQYPTRHLDPIIGKGEESN